jgi:Right handed beta helix region
MKRFLLALFLSLYPLIAEAAVSCSNLTSGDNSTGGTSATTASISPTANALVLVSVSGGLNSGTVPTVTGASGTWTQIIYEDDNGGSGGNHAVAIFRDLSASPGTGALTISWGSSTENHITWSIDQCTGTDTTGTHGSGAIVQSVANQSTGTDASFTVTLATLGSANNAAYGFLRNTVSGNAITKGSSFTELANNNVAGSSPSESEWAINQTAINWTFTSASYVNVAAAIEIKAASGGGGCPFAMVPICATGTPQGAPCVTGYKLIGMISICGTNTVPMITSSLTASGIIGTAFSYTITATNSPTSFNATSLPSPLTVNTGTGVISGTPTAVATTNVGISATNASGTGNATLTLTISPSGSVAAVAANTFLNSMGVQTHIDQGYAEAPYEAEFAYTGIRNGRDASNSYAKYITLHNNTASSTYPGTKWVIGGPNPPSGNTTPGLALDAAGALLGFEGPNEPNNSSFTYLGTNCGGSGTWVGCANFQRDLHSAIKGNSTLSHYPVWGISETGAENDNAGVQCNVLNSSCAGASAVTLIAANTVFQDYANDHNYVQGNPGCDTPHVNQAWNSMDILLNSCWDGFQGNQMVTWNAGFNGYSTGQAPGIPRVSSETGWDSSTTGSTIDYQGKIITLTYLDGYKRGNTWTSIYEMVDQQGSVGNQGLYDTNNVAKLAATYVHNFTTILQDTTNFTPGGLTYSIASEPSSVHDMLLEKSNGDFYLVLWDEETTSATTNSITVTLGTAANVTIYDTTMGATPIAAPSNTASIPLTLSDHPVILQISSAALAPAFYVAPASASPAGNDSNAGTLAAPFLTIEKCKNAMEGSGTNKTCYIRAGNYAPAAGDVSICSGSTTCAIGLSSASDNGETFSYYPPDGYDTAIITGGSTAAGNGLYDIFWVGNTTGVTINGLSMQNFQYAAVDSGGGNSGLTVTNNLMFNGFNVSGSSMGGFKCYGCASAMITNNVVHDIASFGITLDNVNGNISNSIIANNVVYNTCTGLADCGGIYIQDLAASATNLSIKNNYVHDGAVTGGTNLGSGIYLDDCTSNVTVSGNVVTGNNGGNTMIIHGGNSDTFTGNLIDLSTRGQKALALQTSSGSGCSAGTMSGNAFKDNILVSGGGGGGYSVLSGSPVNAPTITNNAYHNYAGSAISSTGSYSDANPVSEDPSLTCWAYTLGAGSLATTPPVTFSGLPGVWGPPGFSIPHTGTVPSSPHSC